MNKLATFFRESQVARFLIPAGLILTIFGVVFLIISMGNNNYVKIEATVTSVKEDARIEEEDPLTYTVKVSYQVGGKDYEAELSGVSKYSVGDKMTIYYNPSNPSQVTQTKSLILPFVMIAGGIAAFIAGIVSGENAIKRYKKMKEQEKGWENGQ